MGRERLAEKSMMAHFRIDINQKKFLTALARKLGKRKNFSALVRDAIEQYIQRLQEEEWLSGDLMLGDQEVFPKANFYFQILSKNLSDLEKQEADLKEWLFKKRIQEKSYSDMFQRLDISIKVVREMVDDFPWRMSSESLEKFSVEMARQILALKLTWARQAFLFLHWINNWKKQKEERDKKEEFTKKYIKKLESKGGK